LSPDPSRPFSLVLTGRLFLPVEKVCWFDACRLFSEKNAAALVWVDFSGKIELKLRWTLTLCWHVSDGCKE
jgi:hypothetical protein